MQPEIAQLSKEAHKDVKLAVNRDFSHVEVHHITPVIAQEIAGLAQELPIAFIKQPQSGDFVCVAVLGFKEDENLLVKNGQWQGKVIPAGYTHYPLALVPMPDDEKRYTLTLATNSSAISEEGEALFNEDGSETEYLQTRRQSLEQYYACALGTREFTKALAENDLLEERPFSIEIGEDKRNVTGLFVVNEKKLNELSDEKFLELRKRGYLSPIYGHLLSLAQIPNLVERIKDR